MSHVSVEDGEVEESLLLTVVISNIDVVELQPRAFLGVFISLEFGQ